MSRVKCEYQLLPLEIGHRSKVKVNKVKNVKKILVFSLVSENVVQGQGQSRRSKLQVKVKGRRGQGQRV